MQNYGCFCASFGKKKINHNASIQSWLHVEVFHDAFHDFDRFPVSVKSKKFAASVKKSSGIQGKVIRELTRISFVFRGFIKKSVPHQGVCLGRIRGGEGVPASRPPFTKIF